MGFSPIGVKCQFLTFINSVYIMLHGPPIYIYCLKVISFSEVTQFGR